MRLYVEEVGNEFVGRLEIGSAANAEFKAASFDEMVDVLRKHYKDMSSARASEEIGAVVAARAAGEQADPDVVDQQASEKRRVALEREKADQERAAKDAAAAEELVKAPVRTAMPPAPARAAMPQAKVDEPVEVAIRSVGTREWHGSLEEGPKVERSDPRPAPRRR